MSWAVVRGEPTAAQRYLDAVLSAATAASATATATATDTDTDTGAATAAVSVAALLLHCMRQAPDHVFMVDGASGRRSSAGDLLARAVPLARALRALRARDRDRDPHRDPERRCVAAVMRNHERAVALYLAALFAAVPLLIIDPAATQYELAYYLRLGEPAALFCEPALRGLVTAAASSTLTSPTSSAPLVTLDDADLQRFAAGYSDDLDTFTVPHMAPDDVILILPTSGSTGMPKAAMLTNQGLLAQIPIMWTYHCQFPSPTRLALVLATPQWVTFTMMLSAAAACRVSLLMSPRLVTYDHVLHMMETYRPTFALIMPSFAKKIMGSGTKEQFSSLETIYLVGAPISPDIYATVKEKVPQSCRVCDSYGLTEAHCYVVIADPTGPPHATGRVANTTHYKLIKEDGTEAAAGEDGELLIKSVSLVKGYLRSDEFQQSLTADGFLRTGDEFCQDETGNLYYRRRIKFTFRHRNRLVSPEEVERVASGVSGVAQLVVCCSRRGPAAALVLRNGADPDRVRRDIHAAVDSALSEHKRLSGGVFAVREDELPRTHTGKVQRARVEQLIAQLTEQGRCT